MKPDHTSFAQRGGWWVVLQLLLMLLIVLMAPWTASNLGGDWGRLLAAGMMLAGAVIGVAGTWALGGNLTPYTKPKLNGVLVQHGIYACVRHPLYLCQILLMTGWALWFASFWAVSVNVLLAIVFDRKATMEERVLVVLFPDYESYRARVPRLFPWCQR